MKRSQIITLFAASAMLLTGCQNTEKYVDSITLSAASGTTTETGYDMVIELDKSGIVTYTYKDAKATPTFKWVADTKNIVTFKSGDNNTVEVKGKAVGETVIYATTLGKGGSTIKSNELKVKVKSSGSKTNDDFEHAKTTYKDALGNEKNLYMNTIYKNQNAPHLDSLQENHVLVVPFGFTDESLQAKQNAANIQKIKTTFFGTEEEIRAVGGWESLASFYNTSSYGKTKFQGDVLNSWCVYNGTAAQFKSANAGRTGPAAAEYARNWYVTEYAKTDHGALGADAKPFTYYDNDGDGFLDLVWMVYSRPTVSSGDDTDWWAYVTYTNNSSNKTKPSVKTLGWASIDWMEKGFGGYDSHTYIHETGHTFGLDDYYDYNHTWAPMGGVDFMDHNLGDHCMFSKFTLGWTSPLVVNDSATITLRPGTTTGDCFLIPSPGYNGTAFDEYILVELMAPVGLAEKDYKDGYENTSGYNKPGLRITHVDARVYQGNHDAYCVDNPEKGIDFRICNTSKGGRIGTNVDGDYYPREDGSFTYMTLNSLFESSILETNWTNASGYNASSDTTLFKKGNKFNLKSGAGLWADTFMPSKSNLWNKSCTTTGWDGDVKTYTIDKTCTFNYQLSVTDIATDPTYGWVATVRVTANAY